MNTPRFDVLIIGGGFSGTILAVQLLYRAPALKIAFSTRDGYLAAAWPMAPVTNTIS